MAFQDTQLPDDIERGADGGLRFQTTVADGDSGHEQRNIDHAQARFQADISYGINNKAGYTRLINFHAAMRGRAHSFRFKWWADFEQARQVIGTTDTSTATFQIKKDYTTASFTYQHDITKPVSGTLSVWVNNVSISEGAGASQYQVDLTTGIITLGSTLVAQSGTDVETLCEFDFAMRFNNDLLKVSLQQVEAGTVPPIMIKEVKGE